MLTISLFDLFRVDSTNSNTTQPKSAGYAADGKTPSATSAPGTIFYHGPSESLHVTCSDGSLLGVKAVQFEGKKRLSAKDFHNGYHVHSGSSRFE